MTRPRNAPRGKECKDCKAERGTTQATIDAFNEKYGSENHPNNKNAFGKCVSSKAQETAEAQQQATLSAAKKCKAERKTDATAFATAYGTKKNAFGKCVSKNAKEKPA